MIIGVGIDLIEVSRVAKVCETNKRFVERVFAESEVEYSLRNRKSPYQHLAACWAAKEAFYKATNIRCSFADVVVCHYENGQPILMFGNTARKGLEVIAESLLAGKSIERAFDIDNVRAHLSISHIKDYATAIVVVEVLGSPV